MTTSEWFIVSLITLSSVGMIWASKPRWNLTTLAYLTFFALGILGAFTAAMGIAANMGEPTAVMTPEPMPWGVILLSSIIGVWSLRAGARALWLTGQIKQTREG